MNIFVCVKQVPATSHVQVDEQTGVLKRDGVASKMNPYDLYALETALRLRQAHGGKVAVGTMGPPQAQAVIREAYMMGADEGYVFSDRRLGGADVLATSYTLSQAIRSVGDFDLILCGKQTTDGDTAQVGRAIAEHLGIPHAAWVSRLEADGDGSSLSLMDVISVDDDMLDNLDARESCIKVRQCVKNCLNEREAMIIGLRYGLGGQNPLTQREIAARCGISRSYVSRRN